MAIKIDERVPHGGACLVGKVSLAARMRRLQQRAAAGVPALHPQGCGRLQQEDRAVGIGSRRTGPSPQALWGLDGK